MKWSRVINLTVAAATLIAPLFHSSAEFTKEGFLRKVLKRRDLDPGSGKLVRPLMEGSAEAIQSQFDNDVMHMSHKVLGSRGSRSRGGGGSWAGHSEPRVAACDRSGGKCSLCALTRGSWCEGFYRQKRVPWKAAPRGSKECPATKWGPCNGVGNCHYDIGVCQCPAGWRGAVCDLPDPRPCANGHRSTSDPLDKINSAIGPDGMDLDLTRGGWTSTRCAGFCDADRASCWCPPGTKYGRELAPPGSPPWMPYVKSGRIIRQSCKPGKVRNKEGQLVENHWGDKTLTIDDVMGPQGWCNADSIDTIPRSSVGLCGGGRNCAREGLHGPLCDVWSEETCLNQCTGHGECDGGYCRCHPGWYGQDCARKKAGEPLEPGLEESRPWLQPVVVSPVPAAAATEPPPAASATGSGGGYGSGAAAVGRRRPLIYVYDMPPEFTSRMLQYKQLLDTCGYRQWTEANTTEVFSDVYSIESYLHEMLSISPYRTFDPEEADFFYVPVYYTCWMWPVGGKADVPFWGAPTAWHRYSNAANMWLAAKNWIQSNFPYWNRRGGRDHIWLTNHDEGACYMPTEIYNTSIMLTHWGRLDLDHTSNTAYAPDNYTAGISWPGVLGGQNVKTLYEGHPCYDPRKDLVIPGFKPPQHYRVSPLLAGWPYERDILLYLRGDVGKRRMTHYSRGIRQRLYKLAMERNWAEKHRIFIGEVGEIPGDYSDHLSRSIFCPVVPGDGFALRMEDAVLHGCLPLIIMDGTHAVFETILDLDAFSIRIQEEAVDEHLPYLLKALPRDQIERMQRRLAMVWHRFAYGHGPIIHLAMRAVIHSNQDLLAAWGAEGKQRLVNYSVPAQHPFQPLQSFPAHTDALATIIQWLHSRIEDTRGGSDGEL